MTTPSPLAAHSLRRSLELVQESAPAPMPVDVAGRALVGAAWVSIEVDGEWLPDVDTLIMHPEAAASAARITAAAVLDLDDRISATTSLLMRLYRSYASAAEHDSPHHIYLAKDYRAGDEPGNPLSPDAEYLTVGVPFSMPREAVRASARMMLRAHDIGMLETEQMRTQSAGVGPRADACNAVLSVLRAIMTEAADASGQRHRYQPPTPYDAARRAGYQYIRDRMAAFGSSMQEQRLLDDNVAAIAQNLVTGESHVPDITYADAAPLKRALRGSLSFDERGSGGRVAEPEDWIAPQWIRAHLAEIALHMSPGDTRPGADVAVPFPDIHSMHLDRLLSDLTVDAHDYGADAFSRATSFVVYALQGMSERARTETNDALVYAARTVARRTVRVITTAVSRRLPQPRRSID